MDSNRKTAIIVGVLFITVLVSSMLHGVFSGSIDNPDYLIAISENEKQVLTGVLLMVVLTASVVAIPIVMFPILRKHNEILALGYVVYGLAPLLLLTLSREFVEAGTPIDSYYQTSGALLLALRDWASILENFPYALGALILNLLLYQSKLVPRWLSVWGLIGAVLMLAVGFFRMFGNSVLYLAIPIILNELVLAIWLIVKGFNSSAITLESAKADIN